MSEFFVARNQIFYNISYVGFVIKQALIQVLGTFGWMNIWP